MPRSSLKVQIIAPDSILGKAKYRLLEDVIICGVKIPKRFIFDGATVPRLFWWLLPPVSSYFEATCLHDYLLSIGMNRKRADAYFRDACIKYKVSTATTNFMFVFITLFGFTKKPMDYFLNVK